MRICPKCGYVDHIMWRTAAFFAEHQYAAESEIEWNDIELWQQLKDLERGEIKEIGVYVYWKSTRSDTVRRCWIEDFKRIGKRGSPQERSESTKNSPGQWPRSRKNIS